MEDINVPNSSSIMEHNKGLLFCLFTIFLSGATIFIIGFFPATYGKLDASIMKANFSRPTTVDGVPIDAPKKQYKQIILMIVDALRYDFVQANHMPFAVKTSCEQIRVRTDVPTVTMPRLKSLTTGTLSSFIDIVLNLGSTEQIHDSLLHRLHARGDVLVFAGDRTWMNLFPNQFSRTAPTVDSFFVKEFYEGDKNVTRTLKKELKRDDWNFMVLHYLGLDHIGHVEGSNSSKIHPKLREMDNVVQDIVRQKNLHNQMLLVTGDHGMRNGGGHGGSTLEELIVPLVTFRENCTKLSTKVSEYKQIDLTPTLSILQASDIPKDSLGCLIPFLLANLTLEEQLYAYHYNAQHLMNKALLKFGAEGPQDSDYNKYFAEAKNAHIHFLKTKRNDSFGNAIFNYQSASSQISQHLTESLVRFDYDLIVIGLLLTVLSTLYAICIVFFLPYEKHSLLQRFINNKLTITMTAICINGIGHFVGFIETSSWTQTCLLTFPIALCLLLAYEVVIFSIELLNPKYQRGFENAVLFISFPFGCFLFNTFSLASSSFIELEHNTWYYMGTTILLNICLKHIYHQLKYKKERGDEANDDFVYVNIESKTTKTDEFGDVKVSVYKFLINSWNTRLTITVFLILLAGMLRRYEHIQFLTKPTNIQWLSLVFVSALLFLLLQLRKFNTRTQLVPCIGACCAIYIFRGIGAAVTFPEYHPMNASLVLLIFWLCTAVILVQHFRSVQAKDKTIIHHESQIKLVNFLQTKITCLLIVAALLHSPKNVILLPAMLFTLDETYQQCNRLESDRRKYSIILMYKIMLTIFIGNMYFFCQGNSNSLATIDLNPGYIGQSSYNPVLVGILVTFNTYCAPIIAFFYLILHVLSNKTQCIHATPIQDLHVVVSIYTLVAMFPVAVYLCLIVIFRYHLFIYSVFAPKVFYEYFGVIVFYIQISITYFYLILLKRKNS